MKEENTRPKMKMKALRSDRILKIVATTITCLWLIALLAPMYWLFVSSLKDNVDINRNPPSFVPTMPLEYTIDIKGGVDYSDEDFKKDSLCLLLFSFENQRNLHCGKLTVRQVEDGRVKRRASMSSTTFSTNRYKIFFGDIVERLILGSKYEDLLLLMEETHGFAFDLDEEASSRGGETNLTSKLSGFLSSVVDDDNPNGLPEEQRLPSFVAELSGVVSTKHPAGIFNNIATAWKYFEKDGLTFFNFLKNSVFVSFAGILLQWIFSGMSGFALSKILKRRTASWVQVFFIVPLLIPSIVTQLPLYNMISKWGLFNHLLAVILPGIANTVSILLFKGFFDNIPNEMYEAAKVDGANVFTIFLKVFLPISFSVFGVIAILNFVGTWNDFMWPYMVLKEKAVMTFPIIINSLMDGSSGGAVDYATSLSMSVIASVPTFILFAFFQKQVSSGLVFTGIKG